MITVRPSFDSFLLFIFAFRSFFARSAQGGFLNTNTGCNCTKNILNYFKVVLRKSQTILTWCAMNMKINPLFYFHHKMSQIMPLFINRFQFRHYFGTIFNFVFLSIMFAIQSSENIKIKHPRRYDVREPIWDRRWTGISCRNRNISIFQHNIYSRMGDIRLYLTDSL